MRIILASQGFTTDEIKEENRIDRYEKNKKKKRLRIIKFLIVFSLP